jgi:hypothetical protein
MMDEYHAATYHSSKLSVQKIVWFIDIIKDLVHFSSRKTFYSEHTKLYGTGDFSIAVKQSFDLTVESPRSLPTSPCFLPVLPVSSYYSSHKPMVATLNIKTETK